MAKRGRYKKDDVICAEVKAQTEQSKFDAMPDEIDDPGAVFKMAFLDSEKRRLEVQLQMTKQEGELAITNLRTSYQNKLTELSQEIRSINMKLKEHKDYIEAKYNIALRAYHYDDETGVLKKQLSGEEQQFGGKEE